MHLQAYTQHYKVLFDSLINKDLAVFEEQRLQDLLLCKEQAPSYSITDQDFHSLWKPRVTELLDKRQLYLQVNADANAAADSRYLISHMMLSWIPKQGWGG